MADADPDEVDLTMVTMTFDAARPGSRCSRCWPATWCSAGATRAAGTSTSPCPPRSPNRFVIVQKWERPEDQQAHFDSADMVTMAEGCTGLLAAPPSIDLLDAISVHDLH